MTPTISTMTKTSAIMTTIAAAIMTITVLEMTMRALRHLLSTLTKVIKTITKTNTTKLLECADPSARTKREQIGFPTMAYLWQQDDKQMQICVKPPFKMASCSSQQQT